MKKIKVCVIGSSGRMGTEIAKLIEIEKGLEITAKVNREMPLSKVNAKNIDVIIDFSLPEMTTEVLAWAIKNKKPIVSGTTGLSEKEHKKFKEASKTVPVLWAPNMSLGVAIMNHLIKNLPKLDGFDYQIEEFHHIKKKDRPSGTALFLQKTLNENLKKLAPEPVSIRGGGIYGIHKLHIMGQEETLTIEHTALSRTLFARGAVVAAKWIADKPRGQYNMSDVLGES